MGTNSDAILAIAMQSQEDFDLEALLDFLTGSSVANIATRYRRSVPEIEDAIRRCVLAHGYTASDRSATQ
jgi:hypothetical protein